MLFLLAKTPDEFYESFGKHIGYRTILIIAFVVGAIPWLIYLIIHLFKAEKVISKNPQQIETQQEKLSATNIHQRAESYVATPDGIREHHEEILSHLSPDEIVVLKMFTEKPSKTLILSIFEPSARSLVHQGILEFIDQYPDYQAMYQMENWVWDMLRKHPKYLNTK